MKKRVLALMLMMVICFTTIGIVGQNKVAEAATGESDILLSEGAEFTEENLMATSNFVNEKNRNIRILFIAPAAQDINVVVTNTETGVAQTGSVFLEEWQYDVKFGYINSIKMDLKVGVYQLDLQATQAGLVVVGVLAENKIMEISVPSFTITAGQKKTLKVIDAPENVTWSSNKPAVASVSSKGVVTAKKAGKAVVTATSGEQKVKCVVTVKKNEFKGPNITLSDVFFDFKASVTKVSYKGSALRVTIKLVNTKALKITRIKEINVKITDSKGKKITDYTFKNLKGIGPQKQRTIKLTIPKKYVKKKNADLRNAVCVGDMKYEGTY